MRGQVLILFLAMFCTIQGIPVVLKGSSPSGDAVVTISSNDPGHPAVVKYYTSNFPGKSIKQGAVITRSPGGVSARSFSIGGPGQAASAQATSTGRGFVSTSAFNPFLTPLFFNPINFEGIGLGNFGSMNFFKGFESFPDARFSGPGTISSVSAVNDNGRVYGNVKTIRYNAKPVNNDKK